MPEAKKQDENRRVQLRVSDQVNQGAYANMMRVDFTREEFIFDFISLYPQQGTGAVVSRLYMNPAHVKRMADVLTRSLKRYEEVHGSIHVALEHGQEIGFQTA